MEKLEPEAEPHFSQPVRQIIMMLIVLGLTGFGAYVALPRVMPVFQANPLLNGFILLVFIVGVFACFYLVMELVGSVRWIEGFVAQTPGHDMTKPPQLLAPLAALLRPRGARAQISSSSARSILDSVATRLDEVREITRYIVNLLIFLGLLGTFYGLATTVPAVVDTIRSLAPQNGETGVSVFNRLMTGLEAQLGGMGVAFASSLLGLAGSLIVGLLELFAGHGQNRFYRELEEWLSSITRLGFANEGEGSQAEAMTAVLDHMAEQMEALQMMFTQSDVSRSLLEEKLDRLATSVSDMTQHMGSAPADALTRVAEGQEALLAHFKAAQENDDFDPESRMRLRSIDVQLLRILEELTAGRQESMAELRADLMALTGSLQNKPTEQVVTPRRVRQVIPTDPGTAQERS